MRVLVLAVALAATAGCGLDANLQEPPDLFSPAAEAVEICGPPCVTVDDPRQVLRLVQALNAGGEGNARCDDGLDQQVHTLRVRVNGRWTDDVTVPVTCGSTQGTATPYKVTDDARDLLNELRPPE